MSGLERRLMRLEAGRSVREGLAVVSIPDDADRARAVLAALRDAGALDGGADCAVSAEELELLCRAQESKDGSLVPVSLERQL